MSFRNYYDASYGRSRADRISDRPTTVTAKYTSITPSYKTSSIPVLCRDRSASREETPVSAIASRYERYNPKEEKPKFNKDYNRLTVPNNTKSREPSPNNSSKYSLSRSPRTLSPTGRNLKTPTITKSRDVSPKDKDKDISIKNDKNYVSGYSGYKAYPRTSAYNRPISRTELKTDIALNRYGIGNRISNNYIRGSSSDKAASISPSHTESKTEEPLKSEHCKLDDKAEPALSNDPPNKDDIDEKFEQIKVITRHTSPTPPGSSVYVRMRRADMAKIIERTITKSNKRPPMVDKEIQSDRLDDSSRNSRFVSTARASLSTWSSYTPSSSSYCGYAGRYSTQYANLRDQHARSHSPNDRSENNSTNDNFRSNSKEIKEFPSKTLTSNTDKNISNILLSKDTENPSTEATVKTQGPQMVTTYKANDDEDTSEIIINVNLKLKKTKPNSNTSADMVSPEVTITNCQLPPQAPKADATVKVKKVKLNKTTSDSSSDSKKKVVKKRKSSNSSLELDQSDRSSVDKTLPLKESTRRSSSLSRTSSTTSSKHQSDSANLPVRHSTRYQNSRESNSPDSTVTISTQTSCSDEETASKSKSTQSTDLSRTSADEMSIQMDKSGKHSAANRQAEPSADEAKSFLIRALAPVTSLFKIRQHDNSENTSWLESTSESTSKDAPNMSTESECTHSNKNISINGVDNKVSLKNIRHVESGERSRWTDAENNENGDPSRHKQQSGSSDKKGRRITRIESGERAWWMESNSEPNSTPENTKSSENSRKPSLSNYKNHDSEEKPWWLDNNSSIPEGVERLSPVNNTDCDRSDKFDFYKIRHIDSGEKAWWQDSTNDNTHDDSKEKPNLSRSSSESKNNFNFKMIRHVDSGERPWWLSSNKNIPEGIEKLPTPSPPPESESSLSEEVQEYKIPSFPLTMPDDEPLGARRSPEGLETPKEDEAYRHRMSPYENTNYKMPQQGFRNQTEKFVSRYTDIDDIFGTSSQMYSPFMDSVLARRTGQKPFEELEDEDCEEIDATQVRIHDSTAQHPVIKKLRCRSEIIDCRDEDQLDDVALQVYKNNDYGVYLDLDSTISEQHEELEGMRDTRRNAVVLRTQLPVRVHSIIERLREAEGRELRKALFSLKQVLQRDKDLVHEFVESDGLDCLMAVGASDNNHLEHVLRALGQIVLYVDGMHGVMHHKTCIQWLYTLLGNPFRHIVKNCLKLLMVFVEYNDKNCTLLINAIHAVDKAEGRRPWENIMKILKDFDASDTELLIYATTLVNRCLNNAVNKDVYYDQVDSLEEQGFDDIIKLYMSKQGTDLDLLRQFQIYEAVLSYEDGDESGTALKQLDDSVIKLIGRRSSLGVNPGPRRKSKKQMIRDDEEFKKNNGTVPNQKLNLTNSVKDNQENQEKEKAIKRRRDRFARQSHHIIQQQELFSNGLKASLKSILNDETTNYEKYNTSNEINGIHSNGCYKYNPNIEDVVNFRNRDIENERARKANSQNTDVVNGFTNGATKDSGYKSFTDSGGHGNGNANVKDDVVPVSRTIRNLNIADVLVHGSQRYTTGLKNRMQNGSLGHVSAKDALIVIRNRIESGQDQEKQKDHRNSPEEPSTRVAEMTGLLLKAKEGLAKSQSKEIIKSPLIPPKPAVSENELQWEELKKGLNRVYHICDLDFSDLARDEEDDVSSSCKMANGVPPPPLPPPMRPSMFSSGPPPPPVTSNPSPALRPNISDSNASNSSVSFDDGSIKKNKKTVKLFWKEVSDTPMPPMLKQKVGSIWDTLPNVHVDTDRLEHLFESRTNDLMIKEKLNEPKKTFILDTKRSNAINIGMKKLPTPQAIKAAIMKMDATVIGREGIEKLLTMLPTEEEKIKIQEAQYANPDLPLGNAEQFLLALASITELPSRLKLWLFKLDFENVEKEIAEPLMDLKQGIELLKANTTFKVILSTIRSVGSFLNGTQVKGFRLEYLSKVMEVKDTVHKHPLLYHICEMIIKGFPESSDFFSEVGPVIRASKVDFDVLKQNLIKQEADCKSSWDHLKKVAKHDGPMIAKTRVNEFLTDAAERIILLGIIEKKVLNRFNQFLLHIGVPLSEVAHTKPSAFLKILSEFALEYMTSRERVLQQLEKKANHRERNKTRGKLIIESGNYSNKNGDIAADAALRELLLTDGEDSSAMGRKKQQNKHNSSPVSSELQTPDQVLESLVKSSMISHRKPKERRRARLLERISLERTTDTK